MTDGNISYHFKGELVNPPEYSLDVVRYVTNPGQFSDTQVIKLAKAISLGFQDENNGKTSPAFGISIPKGVVYAEVDSPGARDTLLSVAISAQKTIQSFKVKNDVSNEQIGLAKEQLSHQTALLADMKALAAKGYISKPTVLQQEQEVDSLKAAIESQRATIAETNASIATAVEDIRSELSTYINTYAFISTETMHVYLQDLAQGQPLSQGDNVLIYSPVAASLPTKIPIFMDAGTADQAGIGDEILATPIGFDRSRYGGIQGKLITKSVTPISISDVVSRTGVEAVGTAVQDLTSAPWVATAELATSKDSLTNQGIYQWSSRGNPPAPVQVSDILYVDITTQVVKPIELVLPALRRFFGVSSNTSSTDSTQ